MEDLKQVGLLRRALKPLIEPLLDNDKKLAKKLIDTLERVEKRLSEKQPTPIVNVEAAPAPVVNPQIKVDLHDLIEELKLYRPTEDIRKGLDSIRAEKSINDYRPHDQDDKTPGTEYAGFVAPNGNWYIVRAQNNVQRYSFGKSDYSDNWDRRAKLDFDYLDKTMA